MHNQRFYDLPSGLLALLLLLCGSGLRAQCSGPFELNCLHISASLDDDCQATVRPWLILSGLPECLTDSNFIISIEDDFPGNGATIDGPGTYEYSVTGQNNAALAGFSCEATITMVDAIPPSITFPSGTIDRGCNRRDAADVNLLADDVSRCWLVDGASGEIIAGSLDGRLRQALITGGGIPEVADGCGGEVEVCVNDAFSFPSPSVCVDTVLLQRSFTARSVDGNPNFAPAFSAQNIRFIRPRISQLRLRPEAVFNSCPVGAPPVNPLPRSNEYPSFNGNNGPIYLNEGFCEFLVDYIDGERLPGCNGNFSFVRTFRVRDWCHGGADTSFTQVVRIGDNRGPVISTPTQDLDFDGIPDIGPLQFSTNTDQCSATLDLRTGVSASDACSSSITLEALIFPGGNLTTTPLGPYRLIGGTTVSVSDPIPAGDHLLRYRGLDPCGNESLADVNVRILDGNAPTAICPAVFPVTLNGAGFTTRPASSFNDGSFDDCGPVSFQVARAAADGLPAQPFVDQITFRCDDLNATSVVVEVSDAAGNLNRCLTEVVVSDVTAPFCTAPADITLNCQLFSGQFPQDLTDAFDNDPATVSVQLDDAFGPATGSDNCTVAGIDQTVTGTLDDCGAGQFVRSFTVTDAAGLTPQNACQQVITVEPFTEYSLRFPGDRNYECGDLPEPEDFTGAGSGCELLAVNTSRDTIPTDEPGSCYALRLTHEVINWCEYDGQSSAIIIPRDANGNGNFSETVFLNVTEGGAAGDLATLDEDNMSGNGNDLGPLLNDYGNSSRRGHFSYTQFVGIFDDNAPVLDVSTPEPGLAFTDDCLGGVTLNFTATDDCGATQTTVTIDELVADRNDDGIFTAFDFSPEYDVPESRFEGEAETGVSVPVRNLPIGLHLARVLTVDGCGNETEQFVVLRVEDGRPPGLSCVNVMSIDLVPDAVSGGINEVRAGDFVAAPAVTCTPTNVLYSLYTEEEAGESGFQPQPGRLSLRVDCTNLGENVLRLYAFAESNGTNAFCNVALVVTDDNDLCADRMGEINGLILTPFGGPVRNAEVFNIGPTTLVEFTDGAGIFLFDGLEENNDYTVRPYLDRNPINGVSTADLNIIGRRLMGIDEGLTPYQLIAADANNNGNITIHDLLMIRELVLGVEDGFDNNTSWRFVPADYIFPDPTDPWLEEFPETVTVENLSGVVATEFTAIKIGDVSGNANPQNNFSGNTTEVNSRAAGVALRLRPTGETGVWGLYAPAHNQGADAGAMEGITAVQAALELPAGTQLLPGLLSPEAYRVDRNNVLRLSHFTTGDELDGTKPLIRFQLSGEDLPQLIRPATGLQPEAYTADFWTLPLSLEVDRTVRPVSTPLIASPNPFRTETRLSGDWPVTEPVTLDVYDAAGRLLYMRSDQAIAGANSWVLNGREMNEASGAIFVVVRGGEGREKTLRLLRK